jgi:hypothetical protein
VLTIAMQQSLPCPASSHLEYGMVQQIHFSFPLPQSLSPSTPLLALPWLVKTRWRERLISKQGRERAQGVVIGDRDQT